MSGCVNLKQRLEIRHDITANREMFLSKRWNILEGFYSWEFFVVVFGDRI
jgi:hypothetical protein